LLAAVIAFRGATLIDGTGSPPLPNALLVISDGRILSVGPATAEAVKALPAGTQVITADGKWIMPGLIDAHAHAESNDDLETMLRWGVTTVRLMSEDVGKALMLAESSRTRSRIPEIFPAAPIFTAKGGWWDQGEPPDRNIDRFPANPVQARAAVRKAKALGSREIKLMLDDMSWCRAPKPSLPRMKPEVAKALIDEARLAGLRMIVHAPQVADGKEAIADGATALAHGVIEPLDGATIAAMKKRNVFYIPTLDIFEFLADTRAFVDRVFTDSLVTWPIRGLPKDVLARYRSNEYSDGYRQRYQNFENVRRRLPALRENLRRLHAAGVPVALGTDMWAFPGLGVSIEMDLYVDAGLSPLEAVRAATQTSARSLEIDGDRGTLEAGKRADFLVLSDDPLKDFRNVRRITDVYRNGKQVGPMVKVTIE
jgi:imidazolonepropionase-like amidohydrolase